MAITTFEPMFKVHDIARVCNVHESTIYRWVATGKLEAVRVGGSLRFRRADIEKLIAGDEAA